MTPNPQHSGQGDPSASAPRTPSPPGAADVGGEVGVKPGEWTRLTVGADLAAAMDATVEIDVANAPGVDREGWDIGAFFEGDPSQVTVTFAAQPCPA